MKSSRAAPTVIVTIHSGTGKKTVRLNETFFYIGRAPGCKVKIEDHSVSRQHVKISVESGKVFVTDQDSANGTFLNGRPMAGSKAREISPNDRLILGKSEAWLSIAVQESAEHSQTASDVSFEDQEVARREAPPAKSVGHSDSPQSRPSPAMAKPASAPIPKSKTQPEAPSDLDLHNARKQAARLIFEAEEKAFHASKAVFDAANKARLDAQEEARKIVAAAQERADKIHVDQVELGRQLLAEARTKADELREHVIADALEKAKLEAKERIGDLLAKKDSLETSLAHLKKVASDLSEEINGAERELETQRGACDESAATAERLRGESDVLRGELENMKTEIQRGRGEKTSLLNELVVLKNEIEAGRERAANSRRDVAAIEETLAARSRALSERESQMNAVAERSRSLSEEVKRADNLLKASQELAAKLESERANKEANLVRLNEEIRETEARRHDLRIVVKGIEGEIEREKSTLDQRLRDATKEAEASLAKIRDESAVRVQEFLESETRKVEDLRVQLRQQIDRDQATIASEIHEKLWKILLEQTSIEVYKRNDKKTLVAIQEAISSRLIGTSADMPSATSTIDAIKRNSWRRQARWAAAGFAAAALIMGGTWYVLDYLSDAEEAKRLEATRADEAQRKLARRFNPAQDFQIRESYTESVLYTKNFVDAYDDQSVYARWLKEASEYLYRQWRIDEASAIEVVAGAKTLVNSLDKRRRDIHPDFVKENIEKMREFERAEVEKLKTKLGTNVKYEAFKKFETRFFANEVKVRQPASQ